MSSSIRTPQTSNGEACRCWWWLGLYDGSTDVGPPLISKRSWSSFSLISHISPSSYFFLPINISLIPGTAGHEGLLTNRCHLYAVLPFSFSFSLSSLPYCLCLTHPHVCAQTHTHILMMFGCLPYGQTCCWVYIYLQWLGHGRGWEGLGRTGPLSEGEMLRRKHRRAIWLQGPQCWSWLFTTLPSDLSSRWEGRSKKKRRWLSPHSLFPLSGLYFQISQLLAT